MPITTGNIVEVRFFCQFGDQGSVNVRHYNTTTHSGNGPDLKLVADEISGTIAPLLIGTISVEAHYRGTGVRVVAPPPISLEALSNAGAGQGTGAGIALPRQVCGIVSLRSETGGRRARGRFYVPFPPTSQNQVGGIPTPGYMVNLASIGGFLVTTITVGTAPNQATLVPVVWSKKYASSYPLKTIVTPQMWATQRRRGSFGRPNTSPI